MEGTANIYYERLFAEGANKGAVMAKFFSELFEIQLSPQNIIMFSKLIKLYGAENVFFATLSSYETGADPSKIYGLLAYICKKKLTEQKDKANSVSLEKYVEEYNNKTNRTTKLKIRSPFDDR